VTNLQDFVLNTLSSAGDSLNIETKNFIFQDLASLTKAVLQFHENRKMKDGSYILRQRKKLGLFAESFSANISTATGSKEVKLDSIRSKIELLSHGDPEQVILLMSAHQPNLFPYSGVTRKIALMIALSETLAKMTGGKKEIVCFFGIADHDFVHNKWIRSAELPAPMRKEGTLRYNVKISQKDIMLPSNKIPRPSMDTIDFWKNQTEAWVNENTIIAQKFLDSHNQKTSLSRPNLKSIVSKNMEEFWTFVERAYSASSNLAAFNSALLYLIVNQFFKEPVLFANFSDCFSIFGAEYSWMLDNFSAYSGIIRSNEQRLTSAGIDSGLAQDIDEVFPLWLKCSCGSKYRLMEASGVVAGRCVHCASEISYSIQQLKELTQTNPELFEPRSISMPIAFARSLDMSSYIGGIGGLGYLMHSREISEAFHSPFPPTPFWYVDEFYTSIEFLCSATQVERLRNTYSPETKNKGNSNLDYARIDKECLNVLSAIEEGIANGILKRSPVTERDKQLLNNIRNTLKMKGCLLDNAINIGLKPNFEQWLEFLRTDGRLKVPLWLTTPFTGLD
jgi:hypothetical protein